MRRARVALAMLAGLAAPAAPANAFWLPPDFGVNNPMVAVAVGDSITTGALGGGALVSRPYPATLQSLLAPQHPQLTVLNRGLGGESTDGGLSRLPGVLATDRPGFVLIMEGTNDAGHETSPGAILANLQAMIRLAKANSSIPLIGAIPPNFRDSSTTRAIIDDVNATLRTVAAQEDVRFVDTFSPLNDPGLFADDRFHPNQQGYDVLAAAWQPALSDAIDASRALLGGVAVAGGHLHGPVTPSQIVAGFGPGQPPDVRTFETDNTAFGATLMPYPAGFQGGVRVAACDVDADGVDEIVVGAGPGGGPHVAVLKPDPAGGPPQWLASFYAFNPGFAGGVSVACGDIDGVPGPEIIVGAGLYGGPHVRAFRYAPGQPGGVVDIDVSFFAYPAGFGGGVRVAVGNLDGDPSGRGLIVTGAGPGGGPHVRVFRYAPGQPGGVEDFGPSFYAYDPGFTGGVYVAAGDLDGDDRAELITGAGRGGGPHVRIFEVQGGGGVPAERAGFFAYAPDFRGGVFVGVAGSQVLTGAGPGGGPHVRGFTVTGAPTGVSFFAY